MIIILLNRKLIDVIEFPSLFKNLTDHSKIKTLVQFSCNDYTFIILTDILTVMKIHFLVMKGKVGTIF